MPDLPVPRSNNAVALMRSNDSAMLISATGLSPGKQWSDVKADAWQLDLMAGIWTQLADVPGPGRLAATAVGFDGRVFVIGGYTVANDGTEVSVPGSDVWSQESGRWSPGPPMPIPVDDAAAGLWRDRWMVLVSGWSNDANVDAVQLLDLDSGTWTEGSPIIGEPVFGHAGALAGDVMVYCGGVRVVPDVRDDKRSFAAESGCYAGTLSTPVGTLSWERLPAHRGDARYRMASGASGDRVVFAGGTATPYNYDGVGYDGALAVPVRDVFAWNVRTKVWEDLPDLPEPSMDHRGLVEVDGDLILVGGMDANRRPTTRVWRLVL